MVAGIAIAALLFVDIPLVHNQELFYPVAGLIFGICLLLVALLRCPPRYVPASLYYLTGGAFTLLAVVAVLSLLFRVMLGGAYIWTVVVGLGFIVIFWLTALYLLYGGERLLHQGTPMRSSPGQS